MSEVLLPEPALLPRVPRRPGRAHPVPDRRPGDALRRQGPRLPAAAPTSTGTPTTSTPTTSPRCAPTWSPTPSKIEKDNAGDARRRDRRLGAGGTPRAVAAPVGERVGEGHPPAGPGARRPAQPRCDRPGAEPARLPGRCGRPPHPLRERRARARPPGDGRVHRAHRAGVRPRARLRLRRRRLRDGRPRARSPTTSGPWSRTCARRA